MPFEEPDIETVRVLLPTRVGSAGTGAQYSVNGITNSVSLVAGTNITLSQNASTITIIGGAGGGGGGNFTLNASTNSVSLIAGPGIQFLSNLSSITILAPAISTGSVVNAIGTAGASSGGTIQLVAGNNITLNTGVSSITIVGGNAASTITGSMAGNTLGAASTTLTIGNSLSVSGAGAVSVGASAGTLTISGGSTLVAGVNLSLTTGGSSITINASSNAISNVSLLNASSGAMSISAGAGIGIGQANSTITISASVQTATVSLTALGNTTSSSSGTFSNLLNISGAGIVSVGVGAGSITISAPAAAAGTVISAVQISGNTFGTSSLISNGTVYLQAVSNIYLSQSTTTGTGSTTSNVISIGGPAYAAAGGLAVSTTGGSVSYSITNHVSSVNGSSGTLSVSAGAGIGIGNANSTITISASVQTSSLSVTALGNTLGAASTSLAVSNALNISGAGIVSVGMNGSTITISATSAAVTNFSNISGSITGNTAGTGTFTIGNQLAISLTGGLSGTASGSSITLSGGAGGAAGTQSLSGGGVSVTGTAVSLAIVAGTNISLASASGAGSLTLTVSGGSTLVAGSGISLASGGSSITIIGTGAPCSYTQNANLQQVAGTIVTKAGTITGTAGVGSSLFLNRIMIPAVMALSEIDVAMSIGFPATSQGAGTMSRSMVLYSFVNSTALASVISTSGTSSWQTGTSTSGAVVSLTQFQGGWSTPLIQPFTFASSSVSPGEYVVGQLFNFAQGSSTWTIAFYGAQGATNASALSSGGLVAASAFTGTTSSALTAFTGALTVASAFSTGGTLAASGITAITQNATNNVSWFVSRATSGTTSVASATSSFTFVEAPFVGSLGIAAGSIITATALVNAISNSVTGAFGVMGSGGLSAGSYFGSTTSMAVAQQALPNFGYIGTGSTTSGLPTAFSAGIMSTGAIPTAITVTSAAVTYSGSIAFQQPWFALLGT